MQHSLIHGAAIAGRILAGVFGCICFYVAFFMYEDEQGRWQNRLDEFWILIHDRAKLTESTTVAIFNRVAEALTAYIVRYFGKRTFSFHAILTSINLSSAVPNVCFSLADVVLACYGVQLFRWNERLLSYIASVFMIFVIKLAAKEWDWRLWLVSILPAGSTGLWLVSLPLLDRNVQYAPTPFMHHRYLDLYAVLLLTVTLSLSTDAIVIVILRKMMSIVAETLSPLRILIAALTIALTGVFSVLGPYMFIFAADGLRHSQNGYYPDTSTDASRVLTAFSVGLPLMNLSSMLYCLVPGAILLGLLLHRLVWPLLCRVLYPLSRYNIITKQRSLAALGALGLTIAFNLEKVGFKEILKLVS